MSLPAQELLGAFEALCDALKRADAGAIEAAARRVDAALPAVERAPPAAEWVQALAGRSREAGALLAARQAAVQWALSRVAPGAAVAVYDSDGQRSVEPAPRPLATA